LEKSKQLQELPDTGKPPRKRLRLPITKTLYFAFVAVMAGMMFAQPTYAATTVWDKASEIMKDVYDLYHCSYCYCVYRLAYDELLPQRPDRGRKPRLAETDRHHLGYSKRVGLYYGICHSLLCGRKVDRLINPKPSWKE